MMKLTKFFTIVLAISLLYGCTSGGDGTPGINDDIVQAFSVDCSASAVYEPSTDPEGPTNAVAGPVKATVIFMHWKIGSPLKPELVTIYNALADAGYDVVAPYMPWNTNDWNGSMCEAMNYINSLAAQEAAKGNDVIIAGHGMGATHALIFGVTAPGSEVKGIIAIAPGHFPHLFTERQAEIASFITQAKSLVASGDGGVIDSFESYRVNASIPISATADDYLSYHALDQFPNILDVLSATSLPVLWLAGDVDPITINFETNILFNRISSQGSRYQVVPGADHSSVVSNTNMPAFIVDWLNTLGL